MYEPVASEVAETATHCRYGSVETENLLAIDVYFDSPGDTTRRPSRGPIGLQTRPDEPHPAPPTDKDKQG